MFTIFGILEFVAVSIDFPSDRLVILGAKLYSFCLNVTKVLAKSGPFVACCLGKLWEPNPKILIIH